MTFVKFHNAQDKIYGWAPSFPGPIVQLSFQTYQDGKINPPDKELFIKRRKPSTYNMDSEMKSTSINTRKDNNQF